MSSATGYYSLIQYCPDPSRLEAANVGVLLFAPEQKFLKALMARDNRRIQQFFGRHGHDWVRINSFKKAVEERVQAETGSMRTLEDLKEFIARRANRFLMTEPRSMRISVPQQDLERIYQELIGGDLPSGHGQSFKSYLQKRFFAAGVQRKLRTDISIRVPTFDRTVTIPYGYQNGRFNLIQPARFEADAAERLEPMACRYAIEGRSLYANPDEKLGKLQLIVVGKFPPQKNENRRVVQKILEENSVRLVASTELDRLIDDIRTTAKDVHVEPTDPT